MSATIVRERWRVVSLGDGKHRLESISGRTVAWLRGHAVGVDGFESTAEALAAAPRLRRIVDEILGRAYTARHRPVRLPAALQLVHDGAHEWVAADRVPLARVLQPRTMGVSNESVALEFVLPSFASEAVALVIARALADQDNP
jgi:hypothetical protein